MPNKAVMFKMMRACIGIINPNDLWVNNIDYILPPPTEESMVYAADYECYSPEIDVGDWSPE